MDTRRNFIKKSAILCAALSLPLPACGQAAHRELKTRNPKRGAGFMLQPDGIYQPLWKTDLLYPQRKGTDGGSGRHAEFRYKTPDGL